MMVVKMKTAKISLATALFCFSAICTQAAEIEMNTARMQAMDKITGKVSVINVPVNGNVRFGSLSIVVRSCKTRPVEEAPENFAFVDVTDKSLKGEEINIFKGWMISSSPATNAVEHPIYDVWLLQCLNAETDAKQLMTEEQLAQRDNLPMKKSETVVQTSAELKDASETTAKKQLADKPMNEMEYPDEESENGEPENIVKPEEVSEGGEFSFDEDEENSEAAANENPEQ